MLLYWGKPKRGKALWGSIIPPLKERLHAPGQPLQQPRESAKALLTRVVAQYFSTPLQGLRIHSFDIKLDGPNDFMARPSVFLCGEASHACWPRCPLGAGITQATAALQPICAHAHKLRAFLFHQATDNPMR